MIDFDVACPCIEDPSGRNSCLAETADLDLAALWLLIRPVLLRIEVTDTSTFLLKLRTGDPISLAAWGLAALVFSPTTLFEWPDLGLSVLWELYY